jgi:ribosomal protein S18 acetylase RimI-like enzyme
MDGAIIRPARDDDLEIMQQIAIEAWEPVYEYIQKMSGDELFRIIYPDWRAEKAEQIAKHYRGDPETALVTEYKGQVVGFITYALFRHKKAGVICNNAISPKYQNRGLGTKQYQKVLEIFRKEGMIYAGVYTGADEAHAPARAAYEKMGFKPIFYGVQYFQML